MFYYEHFLIKYVLILYNFLITLINNCMQKSLLFIVLIALNVNVFSINDGSFFSRWRRAKDVNFDTIYSNIDGRGYHFIITAKAGSGHNHPTFAIWTEDMNGNFIQEIFVTQSVATGIFRYGDDSSGKWEAGERRHIAALPYFFHSRANSASDDIVPSPQNPILDAFSGATPKNNFYLNAKSDNISKTKFRLLFEVNQTWDFNEYWYNAKFPENDNYRASAQPSVIYAVTIDTNNLMDVYHLNPIGHGHFAGETGNLYTNLSTLTTALEIFNEITVKIEPQK